MLKTYLVIDKLNRAFLQHSLQIHCHSQQPEHSQLTENCPWKITHLPFNQCLTRQLAKPDQRGKQHWMPTRGTDRTDTWLPAGGD